MAKPLLDPLDIEGVVITADALLTQRHFASYLVENKRAHYHFTVKANQPTLLDDPKIRSWTACTVVLSIRMA